MIFKYLKIKYWTTAAIFFLFPMLIQAQDEGTTKGMTEEDFKTIKTLKIKNLEKDTYVKFDEGYVLDRYELKKPYAFNFADGKERKVYLYNVYETEEMNTIGFLAIYSNADDGKTYNICIPGVGADKACWGLFIDELKYRGEEEAGLLPTVAFAFSKELSNLLYAMENGMEAAEVSAEEEYEYCFPETALVTMADGSQKTIDKVNIGEEVLMLDRKLKEVTTTKITGIDIHQRVEIQIGTLYFLPHHLMSSSSVHLSEIFELRATLNHPVITTDGIKPLGKIKSGDEIFYWSQNDQKLMKYQVFHILKNGQKVTKVYNLKTEGGGFIADGVGVKVK
ncbi:Hint domain-containing protein [Flexithrix dorotheae]|uniref:Hint domain-containing protein n=1 Tax=Flexithrix dorotheae TaxID=70993 RepID=UPI000371D669|nr:Hint domain-containing protein [Flexithrix dorotheae]